MGFPRKPSARPILIGLAALIGGLYAVSKIGTWLVIHEMGSATSMPLPDAMKKPRVLISEEKLVKRTFASAKNLERVADMRTIGDELVFAGTGGVLRADALGRPKGDLFRYPVDYVMGARIVPLRGGTDFALLTVGTLMVGPALFDHSGVVLWKSSQTVDSAAVGDLDGSGVLSIALGYGGSRGVELQDLKGRTRWRRKAGNPWHMEIPERARGEAPVVLYSNAQGRLVAAGASGKDSNSSRPIANRSIYVAKFVPLRWPGDSGKPAVLAGFRGELFALDYDGKTLARMPAPAPAPDIDAAVVAACRVALKDGREYLAVSAEPAPYDERAMLYIYAPDGTLVYQELLGQAAGGLLAIPRPGRPGVQTLLVGGENEVFSYEL